MPRIIIPDAGPLFSLAAGGMLDLLLNFDIHITDVVRSETINKGTSAKPSDEASVLLDFFNRNSANITTIETQIGKDLKAGHASLTAPDLGEKSIQSYLINLGRKPGDEVPIVVFEDGWFQKNEPSIYKDCFLLSTIDLFGLLEEMGCIPSAEAALESLYEKRTVAAVTVTEYKPPNGK